MSRAAVCACVLAILLGVGLRFWGLGEKRVWHDEVYTRIFAAGYHSGDWRPALTTGQPIPVEAVQRFQQPNPGASVADTVRALAKDEPQHPPLYYVLARVWVRAFGEEIGALRALSALLSLLGLPAMFWLCRELDPSPRAAWTGAALLAASPFFVLYAQEAREYALWAVLILAANAALLRAIRLGTAPAFCLYGGLVAVSLYTSFSTVSVCAAQVLTIVLRERGRPTRVSVSAALTLAASAVLFAPWAWMLWRHFGAFDASMLWSRQIVVPRAELLGTLALNVSRVVVDGGAEPIDTWRWVAVAGVAIGVAALVGGARPRTGRGLLLCLVGVPIALLLGPDLVAGGIRSLSSRYLTPSWLGVVAALAIALSRRSPVWTAGIIGAGLVSGMANAARPAPWTKGVSVSLGEVATWINRAPSALVIGNMERHNPGNLLALSLLLRPGTTLQFRELGASEPVRLPARAGPCGAGTDVFLFSPIDEFRRDVDRQAGAESRRLVRDVHLELWQVRWVEAPCGAPETAAAASALDPLRAVPPVGPRGVEPGE